MTTYGMKKLQEELDELIHKQRPEISAEIEEARGHGDLSENAEYQYAKDKQALCETRIAHLQDALSRAQVVDPAKLSGTRIMMGATVKVVNDETDSEHTYILVGPEEADLDKGLISVLSPLGKALVGKEEGDEVQFHAPNGKQVYEILSVSFGEIIV